MILYSLDTQHYFHALSGGKNLKIFLTICDEMFDSIKNLLYQTNKDLGKSNVLIENDNFIEKLIWLQMKNGK